MKRHIRLLIALLAGLSLLAAACGDDDTSGGDTSSTITEDTAGVPEGPAIKIGAQDFGESAILGEIYGQALAAAGYEVEQVKLGGFRDLLVGAYESGDVNFSPEYAASMLEFLNDKKGEATGDAAATTAKLQTYLDAKELTALTPTGAVDTNAFVVTKETADRLGLATLSDLAAKGADLKLGAPQDCATNPFCIPGLKDAYELDLSGNFTPLESGVVVTALEEGAIDVALLFSTDGRIADKGWVLLEDDEKMLAADNVVPVVSNALIEAYGDDFATLVNDIGAAITTEDLIALNKRFDVDKEDADVIATSFLEETGLL